MQSTRLVSWMSAALVALAAGSAAQGALPADYMDGYIAHEVRIPHLTGGGEPGADLHAAPWTQSAVLTGNLDWRRVRTADVPAWTYLFYDDRAIWVAWRCEVTPGAALRAEVRGRDQDMKRDEHVILEFDVGRTGRVFYRFVINPLGALSDSVIIDKQWNSHAVVKTARDDKGWTLVFGLPFSDFKLETPAVGTSWSFNISTRAGADNSWAPVLGGYHIPEQFAAIVFGGPLAAPARMRSFKPLRAGDNTLTVQAGSATRYLIEAIDRDKRVIARHEGALPSDGRVGFPLVSDRTDHVNFSFVDEHRTPLLSFWRPAEIPELPSRLPGLREKACAIAKALDRYPDAARPGVKALLAEVDTLSGTPAKSLYAEWNKLVAKLSGLERSVTDAWLYAQTLARQPQAKFAVAIASSAEQVMIRDFTCPGSAAGHHELALARNEHEAFQVAVIPFAGPLKQVKVGVSNLQAGNGPGTFDGKVTVGLVGHVKTFPAGSYLPDYVGWYPDPILDFQQTCDINAGDHVAFWVTIATTARTAPGDYTGTITVSAADCPPVETRLDLRVWDIELPQATHLRTAFTYTEASTRRMYKGRWSPEMARRYHDFIIDHRLNVDSLYGKEPLNLEVLKSGAARGMNAFNLFYVGKGASVDVVRKLLEERVPAVKAAGLFPLAYLYGFDEVNDEVFPKIKEIFGMVHSLYPGLPCMTTGYDNTFGRTTGLRDCIDIWVPLIPEYNMVEAARLRAEGKQMWWYLCVGPRHPYPNWFIDSPTIEGRLLMGAMSYKYQVGGVLYFMMNNWSRNDHPVASGPYTDWDPGSGKEKGGGYANGDGTIFSAGPDGPVTTLRFENIRDGLEDYEYLYELARTAEAVAARPATLDRAAWLEQARALLSVPERVVESSSRYTRNPRDLEQFRRQVAESILAGHRLAPAEK